ncbi:MAG: homocitrate synthase/isopropylmalate synthase family protein, partial [Moorellaceae bacterium]
PLHPWKPIVGSNMFAHESGIHVNGVLKNPQTYEIFAPEEVGLKRRIVIGKHSGTAALKMKLAEYGIILGEQDSAALLQQVRAAAVELKRSLLDQELIYLYKDYLLHGDPGPGPATQSVTVEKAAFSGT